MCLSSSSTIWSVREMTSGEDCIEGGACEFATAQTAERKETLLADVWIDAFQDWRHIAVEDEEGNPVEALVGRSWTEEVFPADKGDKSWDQQFSLDVYIRDGEQTLRWSVFWSSVTLGIGDDFYVGLVREGLEDSSNWTESFVGGSVSGDCPNDRNEAKPDRG